MYFDKIGHRTISVTVLMSAFFINFVATVVSPFSIKILLSSGPSLGLLSITTVKLVGFQRCYDSAHGGQWSELQALQVSRLLDLAHVERLEAVLAGWCTPTLNSLEPVLS